MRASRRILRRHALTLLFTGALVYVFVTATAPSLRTRERLRVERQELEARLDRQRRVNEFQALWIRGAMEDPYVRERLFDARERSADLTGPRFLVAPTPEDDTTEQ